MLLSFRISGVSLVSAMLLELTRKLKKNKKNTGTGTIFKPLQSLWFQRSLEKQKHVPPNRRGVVGCREGLHVSVPVAASVVWVLSLITSVRRISHLSQYTCCPGRRGPLMESLSSHRRLAPTRGLSPLIRSFSLKMDRRPLSVCSPQVILWVSWHSAVRVVVHVLAADYREHLQLVCF